nr:MAG: polyprotein [Wufeng shrew picornavirus 1]
MANLLQSVGRGLEKILTLNNIEEEQVMQTPDRISVAGAGYFTSVDQGSVHASTVGQQQSEVLKTSVDLPGSRKTQGERFFLLHSVEWNQTHTQFAEIAKIDVVKLLMDSHFAVDGLLKYHTYARFGLEVQVQINPTPFQQGGLICAMVPSKQGEGSVSCLTVYPHGLLNCNINNVVRIKVPFVYTRGAYNLRDPLYPIWVLTVRCWSALSFGTGTTTYVSVNILGRMTDLEMHGLTPVWTQMMRNELRISSTSNVVNMANYQDSRSKISMALDQEDFLTDPSESGGTRITNFSTWTSIPTLAARFDFFAKDAVGTQIKTIPVSPYYYEFKYTPPGSGRARQCVTSLCSIAQMYCFWRGDIVFDFQTFPTKYHSGRILVAFVPGDEDMNLSTLTMKQATSGPCAVMDIGGTNSTMRFRVPWISDTPYRLNRSTRQAHNKGQHYAIGKIVVFIYNRLACPQGVAPHVGINVYTSAINLECFVPVYSKWLGYTQAGDDSGFSTNQEIVQNKPDPVKEPTPDSQFLGSANKGKINLDEGVAPAGAVTIIEDPLLAKKIPQTFPEQEPGFRRHSSDHMNIYKFMGRAHFLQSYTFNANNKQFTFPISLVRVSNAKHEFSSTLQWFFNLFHLYRGPLDLTIVISGETDVDGMIWFTPYGLAVGTFFTEESSPLSIGYKSSLGAVRFNTRRTGNIQLRLPWYTQLYAISANIDEDVTIGDDVFGVVSIQITNYNHSDEYITFSCYLSVTEQSEFYFPRAPIENDSIDNLDNTHNVMKAEAVEVGSNSLNFRPYEPLRREIAPARIAFANDEWEQKKKNLMKKAKEKFKDVKKENENFLKEELFSQGLDRTGNYKYEDGDVYVKLDGSSVRYGFYYQGQIITVSSSNWIKGKIWGFTYTFVSEPMKDWVYDLDKKLDVSDELSEMMKIGLSNFEYSAVDRESMIELIKTKPWKDVFYDVGLLNKFLAFVHPRERSFSERVADRMVKEAGVQELKKESLELITECKGLLASVKSGLLSMAVGIRKKKWLKWIKFAMKVVKYGLILYLSTKVEDIFVLKMLLGIVALDFTVDFLDFTFELSKLLAELIESALYRKEEDPNLYSQSLFSSESRNWLRDAVAGITVFKAGKDAVLWLVKKMKEWYDKFVGNEARVLEKIRDCENQIDELIAESDEFCSQQVQDVEKEENFSRGVKLVKSLRTLISLTNELDLKKHTADLRDCVSRVHQKIKNLGVINKSAVVRPEPVVCYLYGERGSGKSLLSMALATKLCVANGVDPKKNIYTKPVSGDYWDGYSNQLVCIIDDMGQCTDDEDWTDFCQLVSGCPLRLNMASLDEKGKHFTTPYIICTSNLADPTPKTVYVKEAITRRLHYKVHVVPKTDFLTAGGMLNVELAKKEGVISDLSCLVLTVNGVKNDLSCLVSSVMDHYAVKSKNMDDFIEMWSQAAHPSWEDEFEQQFRASGRPYKPTGKLRSFWQKIKSHKKILMGTALGLLTVSLSLYGGYKLYKKYVKPEEEAAGVYHTTRKPRNVVRLDAQHEETQSVLEIAALVRKNLVRFGVGQSDSSNIRWVVNGLGIRDEWILVPSHAYKFEPNYECLEFFVERNNTFYSVKTGNVEIYNLDVGFQDVVLIRFPSIPKFRDITEHFVSKKDLELVVNRLGTLVTSCQGTPMMISEGAIKYEDKATYNHRKEDGSVVELTIGAAWRGTGEGSPGMCGGALITSNQKIQNAIVGIHVAGGKHTMVAKVITKEMFAVLEQKHLESQRISKIEFTQCSINMVSKTLIHKSPIFDCIDKTKINFPAAMPYAKNNEIDPIQVMLSKYDVPIAEEPQNYEAMFNFYLSKVEGLNYVIESQITMEQAIQGVEGIEPINMKSSPGLPYVLDQFKKEDLILKDDYGEIFMIHPFLKQRVEMNLTFMDNGAEMDVVFVTCPKDELRPLEKVLESKTRAIEACPLDFTIICRMMWAPAISYFQLNPGFHTGVAVGIDPDSDWDSLFKSMKRIGDFGLDLDFSGFDASLSPFMIDYGCKVLSEISGISNDQHRALSRAICYSKHQMSNMIYNVIGSMPSGTPCTSLLNSIINNLNLYYVFSKVFQKSPMKWFEKIKFICYGDDVMIVFSRDLKINNLERMCVRIQEVFKEDLKMTVTSATKGVPKIVPVEELTFLKRKFNLVQGVVRPAISEKTIWSLIAWKRNEAEFLQNLETAGWFAFMHGFDFYFNFKNQVDMMLKMSKIAYKLPSYAWFLSRFSVLDFTREIT